MQPCPQLGNGADRICEGRGATAATLGHGGRWGLLLVVNFIAVDSSNCLVIKRHCYRSCSAWRLSTILMFCRVEKGTVRRAAVFIPKKKKIILYYSFKQVPIAPSYLSQHQKSSRQRTGLPSPILQQSPEPGPAAVPNLTGATRGCSEQRR